MKNSAVNLDKSLRYIDMTMKMEGMTLSESEKNTIRDCLSGRINANDVIRELVRQYTLKA